MNRRRIYVQANTSRDVASLIDLGWSFARWSDAHVEAYVVSTDPLAALRQRLARAQRSELVITDLPQDPVLADGVLRLLRQAGHRALLLPPRSGPGERQWSGWSPDTTASPAVNSEAAVCATIIEQHLGRRTVRPTGYLDDRITSGALTAIFNGTRPSWPRRPAQTRAWPQADRLLLRTIGPDGPGPVQHQQDAGRHLGWMVIPARSPVRMSEALDTGAITVIRADASSQAGDGMDDVLLRAHLDDDAVRFTLPGTDQDRPAGITIALRAASLLAPGLHQSWEMLHELLLMPRLRADLLASPDPGRQRSILLLDDKVLVGADASTTLTCSGQELP